MRATVLVASLAVAVVALTFAPSGNAFAATGDFAQCDSVFNTPGLELICDVTVVNTLNVTTGAESSTVTTKVCDGANGASKCGPESVKSSNTLTHSVSQCNYALDGGGANLDCSVTVINNITGAADKDKAPVGATVNQCVGTATGGGTALVCDPTPAAASGATITQCNGSATGAGGATGVTCTVHPSTQSALLPVTINQCNNSANGGGSSVTCDTTLTNNFITAAATPETTTPVKNVLHDSKTDGFDFAGNNGTGANGTVFLGAGVLMLLAGGLLTAAFATRKAGARR